MTSQSLAPRVRALLADATAAYAGRPAHQRLLAVASHLDEPLRVALAGRVKAGKSTLLNALVGQRVAPTDAGECTRVVTWYTHGSSAQAWAFPRSGGRRALAVASRDDGVVFQLDDLRCDDLDRLHVELPSAWLDQMTLIDTPGMGSLSESVAARAQDFLAGDAGNVDAVLYLLRQLHSSDVEFFETFHDAQQGHTTPVNAVGVLSRADEIGGGGSAAIDQARQVAAGYRHDARILALVHTVVPVAGLLAETASTLRAEEFDDLAILAGVSDAVTGPVLLSAARFLSPAAAVPLPVTARHRLLGLLGMYGVRLALDIIRRNDGPIGHDELVTMLVEHSGLPVLRRLLLTQFAERRDVLKADSALRTIDTVARADPIPAAAHLRQQVEQVRVSAHEFAEIRLLTELRTGQVPGPPDHLAAMERLLGGEGTAPTTRLGLPPDAPAAEITATISAHHAYWRRVAQHPLTEPALARAATALQRTCEGLSASVQDHRAKS